MTTGSTPSSKPPTPKAPASKFKAELQVEVNKARNSGLVIFNAAGNDRYIAATRLPVEEPR
jgi:hypothetical protein